MFLRAIVASSFLLFASIAHADYPKVGKTSTVVTQSTGDRASGFSVTVTSGTAKLVYAGDDADREVFLQNMSADYNVHCGTFSAVTDNTGVNRWMLRKGQDYTTNGTYAVYCVGEDSLGSGTIEIIGNSEYDRKDY